MTDEHTSDEGNPEQTTPAHIQIRDRIANERGINDLDRDLLLTGTDEATLLRQAEFLGPLPDLTRGNVAPREGQAVRNIDPHPEQKELREFARSLFDQSDNY
jgi:hypothetical protein